MKVRLRFSIAMAFTVIVVSLTVGIVGYLYKVNTGLALETASEAMDNVARDVMGSVEGLFVPVGRVVDSAALMVKIERSGLTGIKGLNFFHKQIETLPQVYSLYSGFARDGAFQQFVQLPTERKTFGPSQRVLSPDTRYALRILDDSSGSMADSYIYRNANGAVTGVDRGPVKYDPRVRPWYKAALSTDAAVISDVYVFQSTGGYGITVSKRIVTASGTIIGVVGADITLDRLADFFAMKRIGEQGRMFLVDEAGQIISGARPEPLMPAGISSPQEAATRSATDLVILETLARNESSGENKFTIRAGVENKLFMASFLPFPDSFQKKWKIGVIVEQDEFIGKINQATFEILQFAGLAILFSIIAVTFLSRSLTLPLRRIADEAGRVREFDLDGELGIESRLVEVSELGQAIDSMKISLKSFGAYVPKSLVRSIVQSGTAVEIGGERREISIMFSDIEGFTNKSESLSPEMVFSELSTYFGAMASAITSNNGTIDKYIGDAVMALWNAPHDDIDHKLNACRAVLACQAACDQLNERADGTGLTPVKTRFGLHSGDVMVGNVGSGERMQYTGLGAAVNLGSRIEALNKFYGTQILASESVAVSVSKDFVMRKADIVAPAGTSIQVTVYELFGEMAPSAEFAATEEQRQLCQAWARCYDIYEIRDWYAASKAFQEFQQTYPADKLAEIYSKRCAGFIENAPQKDWNGVQVFLRK
jgi:adenylate cyclase